MKRTFICLLAIFAVLTNGASAAQPESTEITATGTGSVAMPPDMATVVAVVVTNAESSEVAVSENNSRYERVVSALTRLGIARSDITLSYYNVSYNPRPPGAPSAPGEIYGFTVNRSFAVKVRQIGNAGRVSDTCLAAGATSIDSVSFGISDQSAARAQAAKKAVAEARSNAEAVAAAAALHIVGIKSIELGGAGGPVPIMMRAAALTANPPTQFDQSNVNITVSVTVIFIAEP
jgi:uncharacterized protein